MKNRPKFFGIIAMVAVIGLMMTACGQSNDPAPAPGPGDTSQAPVSPFTGTWRHVGSSGGWTNDWTLTFVGTNWLLAGTSRDPNQQEMQTNESGPFTISTTNPNIATFTGSQNATATASGGTLSLSIFGQSYSFTR